MKEKRKMIQIPVQLHKELEDIAKRHKAFGKKPPLWEVIVMLRDGWLKSN